MKITSISSLLKNQYNYRFHQKKILEANSKLKDIYKGKRCFVVGNGSSLNKMDLTKLANERTIVVGNFFIHKDLKIINPIAYVEIEPLIILQNFPKDNYYYVDTYYSKVRDAFSNLKTKLFFNIDGQNYFEKKKFFTNNEVFYLAPKTSILAAKHPQSDITKPNSFMDGAIFASICLAAYMGFTEIYFIGCDVDSFSQKKVLHFYEPVSPHELDDKHTNEEYAYGSYTSLKRWRKTTTYFKNQGIKIFNAGVGGDNDTCERVDYNQLFKQS